MSEYDTAQQHAAALIQAGVDPSDAWAIANSTDHTPHTIEKKRKGCFLLPTLIIGLGAISGVVLLTQVNF